MSKKYNLDNCDILNHDGRLLLVYDDGVSPMQKLLVFSKSYHDFNEKAIKLMGGEDWMDYLFYMDEEFPGDLITRLLADMYEYHKEIYMNLYKKMYYDAQVDDLAEYEKYKDDGYLTMHMVRTDENGHRWAVFDKEGVWDLDDEMLYALADELDIPNSDLKSRAELVNAICAEESDIDDDDCCCCDCSEEDCDYEVECDGDCENCDYAESDDEDEFVACDERTDDEKTVVNQEAQQQETSQDESVNGPKHYNGTECIEEMRNLYSDEAVRWFCICNAYKYRFRKGNKPGVDAAQDEAKARWYEKYASDMMHGTQY